MDYFTSDLHNNHKNIIAYCQRPFHDLAGMRRALAKHWNEVVKNDDRVFLLGDVWDPAILEDLQGSITIVLGNHDNYNRIHRMFPAIEISRYPILLNPHLLLSHRPVETVADTDILNIHGHLHAAEFLPDATWWDGNRWYNCCTDLHDYTPVSLDEVRRQVGIYDLF